ncbi:hypothetical protein EEX84_01345 [Planococcus salinus]|uniref:Uncharacterized protein n=1 Tax=Planococcus salinus TaxID=1848460 RepID=A0A3M8PBC1_9BACL|nr:hypothetical protein EEX84_01345 [Planococcus salinus]
MNKYCTISERGQWKPAPAGNGNLEPYYLKWAASAANRGGTAGLNVLVLGHDVRDGYDFFILWR